MPIYEYSCQKCGRDFEELVFVETPPPCPYCGSNDTQKHMSCCARRKNGAEGGEYAASSGGGCSGCSGGNCASCGH